MQIHVDRTDTNFIKLEVRYHEPSDLSHFKIKVSISGVRRGMKYLGENKTTAQKVVLISETTVVPSGSSEVVSKKNKNEHREEVVLEKRGNEYILSLYYKSNIPISLNEFFPNNSLIDLLTSYQ